TEDEDAAAPATMIKVKPAAPPDEAEAVALLETVAPPPPVPEPLAPPAPAAPTACPSCGAVRKPAAKFCDDCGWMFAADAGLALPSAAAPSIITQRANAMTSSSAVRLQGRYELGTLVNERLGVSRYRRFDHEGGTPKPVPVVTAALAPVAEVLAEDLPITDILDDDIMPAFDEELSVVTITEG